MLNSNMWLKTDHMKSFWGKLKNTVCCGSFFRLHVVSICNNNSMVVPLTNIANNKEKGPLQQPFSASYNP